MGAINCALHDQIIVIYRYNNNSIINGQNLNDLYIELLFKVALTVYVGDLK